jgi:hypothetical protein
MKWYSDIRPKNNSRAKREMQCRGILFSMLIASLDVIASTSQGRAGSEKFCHVLFEEGWSFSGKVLGCKQGGHLDSPNAQGCTGRYRGRYCDLRFSIFTETRPGIDQVTVVCTFIEERPTKKMTGHL